MRRRVIVLGRVLVLRSIATTDVTAGQADSQVDPIVANPQAILAPPSAGIDRLNAIEMSASTLGMRCERDQALDVNIGPARCGLSGGRGWNVRAADRPEERRRIRKG